MKEKKGGEEEGRRKEAVGEPSWTGTNRRGDERRGGKEG